MNAMNNLRNETRTAAILRDELIRRFPEALGNDAEALADMIEGETDLDKAIAAVLRQIDEYETMAGALGEQIKTKQCRKKRLEESADSMRGAILTAMEAAGMKKLTLPEATVSVGNRPAAVIVTDEEAAIAAGFAKTTVAVDKTALKDALKAGELPFALMSNGGTSLTIRRS
jgi:Siphovirus Gp157.